MKKHLLLFFCLLISIGVRADKVTAQQALQKAQAFLKGKQIVGYDNARQLKRVSKQNVDLAYYIFNVEQQGGFVIVSGDDRLPDILGYSDKGELNVEIAPCNLKCLLSCYERTIDSLRQVRDDASSSTRRVSSIRKTSRIEIPPLITTHWGQGAPYNNMCPEIDGQKCLTGCVATAMAQIINYHQWPQGNTSAIDAYTTSSNSLNIPALDASSFDWNNMRNDYYGEQTTNEENQAVAKLMRYCGQSVKMDYGLEASGASRPEEAFKEVFNYSKSVYGFGGKKFSSEHLEELVYDELSNNRPVYYTGPGHAFVVDGYRESMFHINWGWDGDADGYFVLTGLTEDIMPFPFGYSTEPTVGIEPPVQNGADSKVIVCTFSFYPQSIYRKNASDDFVQELELSSSLLCDCDNETFDVGWGLYNTDGVLIKVLYYESKEFPLNTVFSKKIEIGNDIPLGTYRIYSIYRHGDGDWKRDMRSSHYHFIANVKEHSFVLEQYEDDANGGYEEYDVVEIDGITYKLYSIYGNKRANVLPYQITGTYSGTIVIPNEIEYNGEIYNVYGEESAFNIFVDNNALISMTSSIESGISWIRNCANLKNLNLTQGSSVSIQNCHSLEEIEFPITMDYPNIRDCHNIKTMRFKCKALSWKGTASTTVDWDDESLPALTDVYFYTPTPPPVGGYYVLRDNHYEYNQNCDIPVNSHATLHVPKGCLAAYQSSRWKLWNIVDDVETEPYVSLGYCHSDAVSPSGKSIGWGDNNVEFAMLIPKEELKAYNGCRITRIQVYSGSRVLNEFDTQSYEYTFITKNGINYLVKQPISVIRGAWNIIELETPYTITDEDLYVGVGRYHAISWNYSDDSTIENSSLIRVINPDETGGGEWYANVDKHPLPIRIDIEGENVPAGLVIRELELNGVDDVVSARKIDKRSYSVRRSPSGITLNGIIRNRSLDPVESYTVKYRIDDDDAHVKTIETGLHPNATETVSIEMPESLNDGRNHTISTDVTLVNGADNGLEGMNMPVVDIVKLLGDVNGDNNVSVTDVINTISYVLKVSPTMFIRGAAQMNDDNEITVTDVIGLINLVLGSSPSRQFDLNKQEVE